MKLRIFTLVYGDKYLEWLKRSSASLNWPENRKALEGATWTVCTGQEDRVRRTLGPVGIPLEIHKVEHQGNIGKYLVKCLAGEMRAAVETESALLVAPPDLIFGEGTIRTMVKIASENPYTCVAVPHPRVVAETFPELKEPTSNAKLVRLAMEHLHQGWKSSNIELPMNSSFDSGAGWREIGPNLYAVTARIPTCHLVRPKKEDVDFLKAQLGGAWDHLWPEMLVKEQRQRVIGGSDAAFIVELTSARDNRLGMLPRKSEPDAYRKNLEHHKVNRNVVTIWRADDS